MEGFDTATLQRELDTALEGKAHFRLGKELGGGVHGTVFEAERTDSSNEDEPSHAAVKVICRSDATENIISREIAILFRLTHPNIVSLIGVGETEDFVFVLLEYVRGGDLYQLVIDTDAGLSEKRARSIFTQLADALCYIHKCRICHRDIKLENILVDESGNPRLTDFGLSKVMSTHKGNALVHNQSMCGSPDYASPEIWRKRDYAGPEVDVWSLGVVLFCMVTKEFPFDGPRSIMAGSFVMPDFFSPELSDLISRMLESDRKKRISMEDVCGHKWCRASTTAPRTESSAKLVGGAISSDTSPPRARSRGHGTPLPSRHPRYYAEPAPESVKEGESDVDTDVVLASATTSVHSSDYASSANSSSASLHSAPVPIAVAVPTHTQSPSTSASGSPMASPRGETIKLLVQVKRAGETESDPLETQNLVVPVAASDTVSKLIVRVRRRAFPGSPASLELRAYVTKHKIVSSLWRDDLVGDVIDSEDTVLVFDPLLLSAVTDEYKAELRHRRKHRTRSSRGSVSRSSDSHGSSPPRHTASTSSRRHSGATHTPRGADSDTSPLPKEVAPEPASPPLVPREDVPGISPLAVFRTLSLRIPDKTH